MNLVELYEQTPVQRHGDIKVVGDRVFVKDIDGSVDEYSIDAIGEQAELWLVRSDQKQNQELTAIKEKLDKIETKLV